MAHLQIAILGRNALIREGLRHILTQENFEVIHSLEDPDHLPNDPACFMILLDQGPGACSYDSIRTLQDSCPNARLVILADTFSFDDMVGAFRAGIQGYVVKDIPCERLIGLLHLVALGQRVLPGELIDQLPDMADPLGPRSAVSHEVSEMLSSREIEILRCLVIGYPNKLISRRLDISEATVKVHVKAILRKLKVNNRTQAAIYALHHGIDGSELETRSERHILPDVSMIGAMNPATLSLTDMKPLAA